MNVLWITNITFPEAQALLKGEGTLKASGGWMVGAARALVKLPGVKLVIATVSNQVKELVYLEGENMSYYLLPFGKGNEKYNKEYEQYWKQIKHDYCPEVVHIHGSEFSHGLAYVNACGVENVVVCKLSILTYCV